MRTAAFALALLEAALAAGGAKASLWCSQKDSHGFCIVCNFYNVDFTLAPGEGKQPLVCTNMAADPRVSLVFGGTGTVIGAPPDEGLRSAIGLRIARDLPWRYRRYTTGYSHVWGPNTPVMPVGPAVAPLGVSHPGETVAPVLSLTACHAADRLPHACGFTLSGRICLRGLC